MSAFYDRVWFTTATAGTGAITVGAAVTNYRTPEMASIPDEAVLTILITDASDASIWEISDSVYTSATTSLTRVLRSSSSGALLNLSGTNRVAVVCAADDLLIKRENSTDCYMLGRLSIGDGDGFFGSDGFGSLRVKPIDESFPAIMVLTDVDVLFGMTFSYSSGYFRIFSDYYAEGPEPGFILGTYSNQTKQMVFESSGLVRVGTGTFRIGDSDSGAPASSALDVQNGAAGSTNIAGADFTITGSLSTGNAAPGKIILRSTVPGGSGSSQNAAADAVTIANTSATGLRFNGYGAGAITADANGNLTSVSDPRMKHIRGQYSAGLRELMRVDPIVYQWREDSGMEPHGLYAGFDAENVRDAMPLAVASKGKDGLLSLQDRAILAACVNAIKELATRP